MILDGHYSCEVRTVGQGQQMLFIKDDVQHYACTAIPVMVEMQVSGEIAFHGDKPLLSEMWKHMSRVVGERISKAIMKGDG